MKVSRICNVCGFRSFAPVNCRCPEDGCHGIMCQVVTPVPGKRLAGYLYRDKITGSFEVCFNPSFTKSMIRIGECWTGYPQFSWSAEEWQERYGKLPRKGSKTAIILELTHDE